MTAHTETKPAPRRPPVGYHVAEAYEMLRISRSTFDKLAAAEKIRTIRLGGRVLCPASEIDRILNGEACP